MKTKTSKWFETKIQFDKTQKLHRSRGKDYRRDKRLYVG